MTPRQFKCAIICASAAAAAAPVDAATRDYTRIEIGLRDINNHNQGTGGGYFWQNEGSAPLGTLSGTGLSSGIAISDAGHVTGISTDYVNGWRGFLVTPEDTNVDGVPDRWHRDNDGNGINDLMIDLGARHPGGESDARDVNSFGQVVGSSANQAVVWNNGTLIDLGPATYFAYGINDHGQVVGGGHAGTFLINPEDSDANGSPDRWYRDADNDGANDLMTTLFGVGWGVEINEQGQILVQAQDYALLWTPDAPNGTSGSAVSLSPDPLLAIGINNAGQAIAGAPGDLMNAPALWENGSIIDITLDPPIADGQLEEFYAINDAGWIVADHGNLLVPSVPEPSGLALSVVAAQLLIRRGRRVV